MHANGLLISGLRTWHSPGMRCALFIWHATVDGKSADVLSVHPEVPQLAFHVQGPLPNSGHGLRQCGDVHCT